MKTTRHFLFTMLLMTLLYVQPIQLVAQNNFNEINKDINALENEINKLKTNYEELEKKFSKLKEDLENLKTNNNSQQVIKNEEDNMAQLITDVDDLIKRPYSKINVNTIDRYLDQLKPKMPTKKGVKNNITTAYGQLENLKKQLEIYNKACDAVTNKPYDAKLVKKLLPEVRKLPKDKAIIDGYEMDLESQLECYKEITDIYNDIMKDVENYQKNNNKNKIKAHINKHLKDKIKYINQIPYLKDMWKKYYDSIK